MGFGCNAAGVIATRIIDSPRERLIADHHQQLRPLQRPLADAIPHRHPLHRRAGPGALAGLVSAACGDGRCAAGRAVDLRRRPGGCRAPCSRAKSPPSVWNCPPYRPPRLWQTLYTSLIDRTLYRAVAGRGLCAAGRRGHLAESPISSSADDSWPSTSFDGRRSGGPVSSVSTESSCSPTSSPSRPTKLSSPPSSC